MQVTSLDALSQSLQDLGVAMDHYISEVAFSDSLSYLTLELQYCEPPTRSATLSLHVSRNLQFATPDILTRISECLNCWLPFVERVSHGINRPFRILLSCCDGGDPLALSMDSEFTENLIPDLYSTKYSIQIIGSSEKSLPSFMEFRKHFLRKKPVAFWRGSTTGSQSSNIQELAENPRVRECLNHRASVLADFKITSIVQVDKAIDEAASSWLSEQGVLANPVEEREFGAYRFYPDFHGNACSWGAFKKYLLGCLVFRPSSSRQLLYYMFMKPWVHYIPLRHDCSDLAEKLKWALSNPGEAVIIAYNGHILVRQYVTMIPRLMERSMTTWILSR